jgi:hypothetical protein
MGEGHGERQQHKGAAEWGGHRFTAGGRDAHLGGGGANGTPGVVLTYCVPLVCTGWYFVALFSIANLSYG